MSSWVCFLIVQSFITLSHSFVISTNDVGLCLFCALVMPYMVRHKVRSFITLLVLDFKIYVKPNFEVMNEIITRLCLTLKLSVLHKHELVCVLLFISSEAVQALSVRCWASGVFPELSC